MLVNYVEAQLSHGYKIISWEDIADADTLQPFELIGYKFVSIHAFSTGGTLQAYGRVSNEASPSSANSPQNNGWDILTDKVFMANTFPFIPRWVWFEPIPTSAALLNIYMLIKDLQE